MFCELMIVWLNSLLCCS